MTERRRRGSSKPRKKKLALRGRKLIVSLAVAGIVAGGALAVIGFSGLLRSDSRSIPADLAPTVLRDVPSRALAVAYQPELEVLAPAGPVVEGDAFLVSVIAREKLIKLRARFQDQEIRFFEESGPDHRYTAILGMSYGTKPGEVGLEVEAEFEGKLITDKVSIPVVAGNFRSEILRVPPRTIEPGPKDRLRIDRDRIVIHNVYASTALQKFWTAPIQLPVPTAITSAYGNSRVYNGVKHNAHLGTDFRAPTGTPILSPLEGRVALARDLFYTGYTVILDHGFGMFTIYGHMSALRVREGTLAHKGQLLGLSGMTGRSSGPHLHWGAQVQGVKVDPMSLVRLLGGAGKQPVAGPGTERPAGARAPGAVP